MPRPNDSPEVKQSKALTYILRHGAEKEGLHIRRDGLVKLSDVVSCIEWTPLMQLARPRVKNLGVDEAAVFRVVEDCAKKRFELVYGYDPSPPRPKKKQQPKKAPRVVPGAPVPVEKVQEDLAATSIAEPEWTELDFVKLPAPSEGEATNPEGAWFIRAVQGHSIELGGTGHLEELRDDEAGRQKAGILVHGTQWRLWETLSEYSGCVLTDSRRGAGTLPHGQRTRSPRSSNKWPPHFASTQLYASHLPRPAQDAGC